VGAAAVGVLAALLAGCAAQADRNAASQAPGRPGASSELPVLRREDMLWLERVSFGLDGTTVAQYRRLGREGFLERQLHPQDMPVPAPIAAEIAALEVTHTDPQRSLAAVNAQYKAINAMPDGPDKEQARKAIND
jgi:hypothetical protein